MGHLFLNNLRKLFKVVNIANQPDSIDDKRIGAGYQGIRFSKKGKKTKRRAFISHLNPLDLRS